MPISTLSPKREKNLPGEGSTPTSRQGVSSFKDAQVSLLTIEAASVDF